jgi:hypothetical protein
MMLFGYKPEGCSDLMTEIKEKVLVDKMKISFDVGSFRVEKIGRGEGWKAPAIKLTFSNFALRNQILKSGMKLQKPLKI